MCTLVVVVGTLAEVATFVEVAAVGVVDGIVAFEVVGVEVGFACFAPLPPYSVGPCSYYSFVLVACLSFV